MLTNRRRVRQRILSTALTGLFCGAMGILAPQARAGVIGTGLTTIIGDVSLTPTETLALLVGGGGQSFGGGGGSFVVSDATNTILTAGASGLYSASGANGVVTFNFVSPAPTDVPEPGSRALFGTALLVLGVVIRKNPKRARRN